MSILSIPSSYGKRVEMDMNDKSLDIVARNVIILLIAFAVVDVEEATDAIIHIWYSSLIKDKHHSMVREKILPLIKDVCGRITKNSPPILHKTWTFGSRSVHLEVSKESWMSLLKYFEVPKGLTAERATTVRTRVTLCPERLDFREQQYIVVSPAHRLAHQRYREDGLLLPFWARRDEFTVPNP